MGSDGEAIERVVAEAERRLIAYQQDRIVRHLRELPEVDRKKLAMQILRVDFEALKQAYRSRSACSMAQDERIAPIPFFDVKENKPNGENYYMNRLVVMTVGKTHSGKTTFAKELESVLQRAVIIDQDNHAEFINKHYTKPRPIEGPNTLKFSLTNTIVEYATEQRNLHIILCNSFWKC